MNGASNYMMASDLVMDRVKGTRGFAAVLVLLTLAACSGGETCSEGDTGEATEGAPDPCNPLMYPTRDVMNETAPDVYQAHFETSKGAFVIEVTRAWSPLGADRFYNLVNNGYFDGVHFFRVLDGFMAQFGLHGDPYVSAAWRNHPIQDDPVTQSNLRGTVTFATAGPDTRTTQVFINFGDNANLDSQGFSPFGQVVEGMDVVDQLHSGYGESAPSGTGPLQQNILARGNDYLDDGFPDLDHVERATIVTGG